MTGESRQVEVVLQGFEPSEYSQGRYSIGLLRGSSGGLSPWVGTWLLHVGVGAVGADDGGPRLGARVDDGELARALPTAATGESAEAARTTTHPAPGAVSWQCAKPFPTMRGHTAFLTFATKSTRVLSGGGGGGGGGAQGAKS